MPSTLAGWRWAVAVIVLASLAGLVLPSVIVAAWAPALVAAPVLALFLATRRGWIGSPLLSTVWIPVLTLCLVGLAGYLFAADLVDAGGASIRIALTPETSRRTVLLFAEFASWITVGALVVAQFGKRWESASDRPVLRFAANRRWLLPAAAIPAVMTIAGTGTDLLRRATYLPDVTGTSLGSVAGNLAVGAAGLAGYLAASERGSRRWSGYALASTYMVLFFCLGSRRLAIVPLLFAVGACAWRGTQHRRRYVIVGILMAAALLPVPLYLRHLPAHGLVPYIQALPGFSYLDVDWLSSVNNILVAYPITAASAYIEHPVPPSWLWVALNPAPGNMAGWYQIADHLRLNIYTPFSSIGELGNYGHMATAGVGLLVGAVLAYLDRRVHWYVEAGRSIYAIALVGMSALFGVTVLQYNLRSSVRLLLYAVVLDGLLRLISRQSAAAESHAMPVGPTGASIDSVRPPAAQRPRTPRATG